jgi:hypothetical protein
MVMESLEKISKEKSGRSYSKKTIFNYEVE